MLQMVVTWQKMIVTILEFEIHVCPNLSIHKYNQYNVPALASSTRYQVHTAGSLVELCSHFSMTYLYSVQVTTA